MAGNQFGGSSDGGRTGRRGADALGRRFLRNRKARTGRASRVPTWPARALLSSRPFFTPFVAILYVVSSARDLMSR